MRIKLSIVAIITGQIVFSQTPQDQFNKAKELFDNGKNKECIATLQSIEKQIGANPKIYSLYTNAYVAGKDYTNAAISLNKFKKLVGNKRTDAIQSILDLEKEINSGVETVEKKHKETVLKKRLEEADKIIATTKKINEQKWTILVKESKENKPEIPNDVVLRVAKDKGGTYGYIDENSTLVIEPKYDMAYPFKNGKALVSLSNKWMYINMRGEVLQKLNYQNVEKVGSKLLAFKENDLYGFMTTGGELIHNPQFSYYYQSTDDEYNNLGLIKIQKNKNRYGLMDLEGKIIAPPIYQEINPFSDGLARVKYNEAFGCIDSNGKVVIPIQYQYMAEKFSEGYIRYYQGGFEGFFDTKGKIAIEPKYHVLGDFSEGLVAVHNSQKKYKYGYMDTSGKVVIPYKYDFTNSFKEGLALVGVAKGNKTAYKYIDKTGKEIIEIKTNFWDRSSNWFSEGVARIQTSDYNYYFIDKTGNILFTLNNYIIVEDFSDGMACVSADWKTWGFINKSGKLVIPPKFQYHSKFINGEAKVFLKSGEYVVIDKTGKILRNVK